MNLIKYLFLSVSILLFVFTEAQAALLTSSLSNNPVKENQTLTLIVRYNDHIDVSALDISALNQDFEILSNSPNRSTNFSIINGETTRVAATTWTITLKPKRNGAINIPAFEVSGEQSAPITLQVNALTPEELTQPQAIEVAVTVEDQGNESIKPGEQVIVQVELSAAMNVDNVRGQELVIQGASLELLGQQDGQRLENGVARQVVIWRYSVYPDEVDEIIIPSQTFSGTIGGRNSFFSSFNRGGQAVSGKSNEQRLKIEPKPATNSKPWFPAKDVSIDAKWSSDSSQIKVGAPITRTITITADGQRASAIPPLTPVSSTKYKSYQDQPQLENMNSAQGIVGTRSESQAIVPSESGELTLPELRLSWWDTNAEQWREATLPAETVTVLAGANTSSQVLTPQQTEIIASNAANENNQQISRAEENSTDWFWRIATLILGAIVVLQFYLLRKQSVSNLSEQSDIEEPVKLNEAAAWQTLQDSLEMNDASLTRSSIINWANAASPNRVMTNLDELAVLNGSVNLKKQLNILDRQLYGSGGDYKPSELKTALDEARQKLLASNRKQRSDAGVLAPLYPV